MEEEREKEREREREREREHPEASFFSRASPSPPLSALLPPNRVRAKTTYEVTALYVPLGRLHDERVLGVA